MCKVTGLLQRRAGWRVCLCCTVAMGLNVRQLMHIYQGASLSWHWSAGVLATAASGSCCVGRAFTSITSGYPQKLPSVLIWIHKYGTSKKLPPYNRPFILDQVCKKCTYTHIFEHQQWNRTRFVQKTG